MVWLPKSNPDFYPFSVSLLVCLSAGVAKATVLIFF